MPGVEDRLVDRDRDDVAGLVGGRAPAEQQRLARSGSVDAVIACGLVVNGGIYRHEFVAAAVIGLWVDPAAEAPLTTLQKIKLIEETIETIRPSLQRDGGDCELIDVDGNRVMVKLTGACVDLMFVAKNLERIGDHATNIAEMVVFLAEGKDVRHRFSVEEQQRRGES